MQIDNNSKNTKSDQMKLIVTASCQLALNSALSEINFKFLINFWLTLNFSNSVVHDKLRRNLYKMEDKEREVEEATAAMMTAYS